MEISLIAQLGVAALAAMVVFSILYELFASSLGAKRRRLSPVLAPETPRKSAPTPGHTEIELPRSSHRS